ncbi:tetratricopeptide repeat protein [Thermomonospora cellulosilytica]|uniref:Tetratricopeptide repeat protein n=1 Tax=Thermomonospora cellulosilytica TaxID=1411118 RepID=A0A7W3MTG1_9ACTN|nr:tetratricopeptide repeat protein [Thermomonospora cellulosilytica]MBA9001552.1 hypothetical protein [Thermomonospora cellulosilytica]
MIEVPEAPDAPPPPAEHAGGPLLRTLAMLSPIGVRRDLLPAGERLDALIAEGILTSLGDGTSVALPPAHRQAVRERAEKALVLFDRILTAIERSPDPGDPMAVLVRFRRLALEDVPAFAELERLVADAARCDPAMDSTLPACFLFATRCMELGHHERAAYEYERLLAVIERNYSPRHNVSVMAAVGLGACYGRLGRLHDAIWIVSRALARFEAEPGDHDENADLIRQLLAYLADEWTSGRRRRRGRRRSQFAAAG